MTITSAAVRAALDAKASSKKGREPSPYFQFFSAATGTTSVLRFLPDGDPTNPLPWVVKYQIKLPFAGSIGGDYATDEPVTCTYTSLNTFGGKDPTLESTKALWDGSEAEKELARQYYHKPTYICQGFVVASAITDAGHDNPIRLYGLNRSLSDIVTTALTDPEMEYAVHDPDHGRDFNLRITQNGSFRAYTKSSFSIKERPLSDQEREALERFGLRNLRAELGQPPSADALSMLPEMLQASLNDEPFDVVKWGAHYRAYPAYNANGKASPTKSAPVSPEERATSEAILTALRRRNTSVTKAA